jgi:hypothetical protein
MVGRRLLLKALRRLWRRALRATSGRRGGLGDPDGDGVFRLENGVDSRLSRGSAARQFGDFYGVTVKLVLPIDDHFVMEIRGAHRFRCLIGGSGKKGMLCRGA